MEGVSEKKKTDPGWNDPPMLSYSHSNPPPKSRISNKRVAYPLFTNQKEKTEVEAAPLQFAIAKDMSNKQDSVDGNSSEILTKSLDNFNKVLDESGLEQKQVISKMLQNMKKMWEEHNITQLKMEHNMEVG
ncbi:uncharacterized protein LOC108738233 [Agrilus planipennis]|uniref:Uncharacterized protein LOC108738233 n=1 Tax=Agrilus planipennis TaxID=224129 RepID=A0A1W4X3U8_AGRPL|nr:uncharacterized protein LOC108738233 [Agrilus planipennis]